MHPKQLSALSSHQARGRWLLGSDTSNRGFMDCAFRVSTGDLCVRVSLQYTEQHFGRLILGCPYYTGLPHFIVGGAIMELSPALWLCLQEFTFPITE